MTYFMTFVSETRWQIGCSGNLFRKYEAGVARVGIPRTCFPLWIPLAVFRWSIKIAHDALK